jgi:nucleotide-binding universal stress UspA family protein
MRRIMVATDGSEAAGRAVDYAAGLAKREKADLLVANVIGGYGLPDGA